MGGGLAARAMSVAAALVRESFWLFGWPLSLVPCLFAGRVPRPWLSWGVLGAELAYRLAAPKAGVGGAGPLYLFEAVPVLCLLAALGIVRLGRGEAAPRVPALRTGLTPALLALTVVSLAMFVPPKLQDLRRMGAAQLEVGRHLRARGIAGAVVFHEGVVPPWTGLSWAYFPRHNAPAARRRRAVPAPPALGRPRAQPGAGPSALSGPVRLVLRLGSQERAVPGGPRDLRADAGGDGAGQRGSGSCRRARAAVTGDRSWERVVLLQDLVLITVSLVVAGWLRAPLVGCCPACSPWSR